MDTILVYRHTDLQFYPTKKHALVSARVSRLDTSVLPHSVRISCYFAYHLTAGALIFFNVPTAPGLLDPQLTSLCINISCNSC